MTEQVNPVQSSVQLASLQQQWHHQQARLTYMLVEFEYPGLRHVKLILPPVSFYIL